MRGFILTPNQERPTNMSNSKWYVVNKSTLDASGPYPVKQAQQIADRLSVETNEDWEVRGRVFPVDRFEPRD